MRSIASTEFAKSCWRQIEKAYGKSSRHYHNLTHLENLLAELTPYRHRFKSWDTIMMAIVYHDYVYNVLRKDNEERSAEKGQIVLSSTALPELAQKKCYELILATKTHAEGDEETNLFTDADLSILGAGASAYSEYTKQIRKEYRMFPDLLYNPGRKKVLSHFLDMKSIFKTREFADKYEQQARINLALELKNL